MTAFILLAAGAVLAAIAFAVIPLLASRGEERTAPARILALILAMVLLIPGLAWVTYQAVGTPEGVTPQDGNVTSIRGALIELARGIERNPDDVEGWIRLGMAYKELQEYSSAEHALRRALFIDDDNAFVRVELAETLLFESGRPHLSEAARTLLHEALELDPGQQKAMWLLGLDAMQREQYALAASWLEQLEAELPEGNVRNTVRDYLRQARNRAGQTSATTPPDVEGETILRVAVALDEALNDDISGDETVFVIVRDGESPGPPLAVHRLTTGELPAEVEFTNDDHMLDGPAIANARSLRIVARVSRSGAAEARPGDLEGDSGLIATAASMDASVLIDREI